MLIQLIVTILVWLFANSFAYYFTDEWGIAEKVKFLNFKPFTCRKCMTFWTHTVTVVGIYLLSNREWSVFLYFSLIFAVLTTAALWIDEKHNTIDIDD